jgi:hypothetical protein
MESSRRQMTFVRRDWTAISNLQTPDTLHHYEHNWFDLWFPRSSVPLTKWNSDATLFPEHSGFLHGAQLFLFAIPSRSLASAIIYLRRYSFIYLCIYIGIFVYSCNYFYIYVLILFTYLWIYLFAYLCRPICVFLYLFLYLCAYLCIYDSIYGLVVRVRGYRSSGPVI